MPVLLMPTVTSPGFKLSPLLILSTDGWASPTQSLCSGFVYTPILDFVGFSMADGAETRSTAEGDMILALKLGYSVW
jgi:hypothetical protein